MRKSILILYLFSFCFLGLEAKEKETPGTKPVNASTKKLMEKAENCFPPTAYVSMDLNNIRYGLESGGLLWFDKTENLYEVPKGSGLNSMYAGGLWMGGKTPDGQLKLAAIKFRQNGTDFWTGPLSIEGDANASNILCQEFDRHFRTKLVDVQRHNLWFERQELVADGADESILSEPPFEDGYSIPEYFYEWPGNNFTPNYEFRLAPFGERIGTDGENGIYDPDEGDYPGYDLSGTVDCRTRGPQDPIPLFGDETIWWLFNDNGGIHTESTDGEAIGMEIKAQTFVYSTTNEINNMSFYNYVLINRGVQTVNNTYFGQYADADVGFYNDDFVGCDVQRGLGYAYNGDDFDEAGNGQDGYGSNAPAIGIDFFEGPYMDPDGRNNEIDSTSSTWDSPNFNIPYPGIGLGFMDPNDEEPDMIIDNERFGMQKFVYYDGSRSFPQTDPQNAQQFYNYLSGKWQNGTPFTYGGTGIGGDVITNYVVPNDTDPLGYGTNGDIQEPWSEENGNNGDPNPNGDRRFVQVAGPFTLDPGEFNNITVGVVWAQAEGGIEELRAALFTADDKAQALFDNCFRILNGPGAPGVTVQELDQEIILYLSDTEVTEAYVEEDASIPSGEDKKYVFEGYKVYQLASNAVSSADLADPDKARLIKQMDVENGVGSLINYISEPGIGIIPTQMVNGADDGVSHSLRISQDVFTGGNLINHKTYYFMTVAYGYNEYAPYNSGDLSGQDTPYLEGRLSYTSSSIPVVTGIPHKTESETNGTVISSSYGDLLSLTRIEGTGTGGAFLELTEASHNDIMKGEPWIADELVYENDGSPVKVKIIDPLNVKDGEFFIRFLDENPQDEAEIDAQDTRWIVMDQNENIIAESVSMLNVGEEFLLIDYGISIELKQHELQSNNKPKLIGSSLTFEDEALNWLTGVQDLDNSTEQNWIRSGTLDEDCEGTTASTATPDDPCYYNDAFAGASALDLNSEYESILGGIIAPWILTSHHWSGPASTPDNLNSNFVDFEELSNVDIVFTSDKSKWTRVPVLEIQKFIENSANGLSTKTYPRVALSVDKNGKSILQGGNENEITYNGKQVFNQTFIDDYMNSASASASFNQSVIQGYKKVLWGPESSSHPDSDLFGHSFGYGWFPGYAIDVETGERLNMAFGENSGLGQENGNDMIWNPSKRIWNENIPGNMDSQNARFGGMHYIYVFRNMARSDQNNIGIASYDGANRIFEKIYGTNGNRRTVFSAINWCMLPLLDEDHELLSATQGIIPTETTIKLRVNKPYQRFPTIEKHFNVPYLTEDGLFNYEDNEVDIYGNVMEELSFNDWFPYYQFSTKGSTTIHNDLNAASSALDLINVVPNPYYAFSFYETSRLDNRVKLINLPEECTIKIFNTAGTLVRTLGKDNPLTYLEWDLNNENNIQIAGGAYIFHISAPGIGATTVKWFGITRKLDLDNF